MSFNLYLYNKIASLIPETRCYRLKANMLRYSGFNVHKSARIVSSVNFIGSFSLSIGEDTFIGHETIISGGKCSIIIGNYCDIAPRVCIVAGTHEIDMGGAHTAGPGYSKNIVIEDGAWIGTSVTILAGVRIGRKSIVAAGSVVTRDIPQYSIAAGIPCKVIKSWNVGKQKWIND